MLSGNRKGSQPPRQLSVFPGWNSPLKAEEQGVGKIKNKFSIFLPAECPMGGYPKKNPETRVSEKDFRLQKEESHFVIFSSVMKVRVGKEKKKKEEKERGCKKKRKCFKKRREFPFPCVIL